MEFATKNEINTTTMISVDSNTLLVARLFGGDKSLQWRSDGDDDDTTISSITIEFDATTSIGRIAMLNHNIKDFTIFYDGVTANTFVVTGATTVTDYSQNSATSQYWIATSVECTSVTFDLNKTMVADSEKAIGHLYVGDSLLTFDRLPAAKNYKPKIDSVETVHTLSDGGTRIHQVSKKWKVDISYKYITQSFRDDLETVYNSKDSFIYVPFPTTSSWDGIFVRAVWPGDFDFYGYSDDVLDAGYSGSIAIREIPY